MSDASRHTVFFVEEASYGITPASVLHKLRNTGTTLALTKNTSLSEELNENRQIMEFRHGTKQVGGELNFELSYASFDAWLEACLMGTWAPRGLLDDDSVSVASADSSFNDSANGFVQAGFQVGDVIVVSGFVAGDNNGEFKIATLAAGKITVTSKTGAPVTLVTATAGPVVAITSQAEKLRVGAETRSFTVVRHFTDIASEGKPFHTFRGVMPNTLNLTLAPDKMVTGSFACVGQSLEIGEAAPAGTTLGTSNANRAFDGFTGSILEGGVALALATEITLTLENGIAPRFVLFSDETILPQIGQSNVTGSISLYFENSAMVDKFVNESASSLQFQLTDLDGNRYVFDLPRISYTGGQPDVSGASSITLSMPFQALYDATADTTIAITRIPKV